MLVFIKIGRSIAHATSSILLFAALIFVAISLSQPDWQVIKATTSQKQNHRHGLWEDCVMNTKLAEQDRKWVCKMKNFQITASDFARENKAGLTVTGDYHNLKHYQAKTLALLVCGCLCIIVSFLLSIVASYADCMPYRPSCKRVTIAWLTFHSFASIIVTAAMIVYTRYSYDIRERTVQIFTETVEQEYGSSFFNGLSGMGVLLISWILAMGSGVVLIMVGEGRFGSYSSVRSNAPSKQRRHKHRDGGDMV